MGQKASAHRNFSSSSAVAGSLPSELCALVGTPRLTEMTAPDGTLAMSDLISAVDAMRDVYIAVDIHQDSEEGVSNHQKAVAINNSLTGFGLSTWFNADSCPESDTQTAADTQIHAIKSKIDNSRVIVVLLTERIISNISTGSIGTESKSSIAELLYYNQSMKASDLIIPVCLDTCVDIPSRFANALFINESKNELKSLYDTIISRIGRPIEEIIGGLDLSSIEIINGKTNERSCLHDEIPNNSSLDLAGEVVGIGQIDMDDLVESDHLDAIPVRLISSDAAVVRDIDRSIGLVQTERSHVEMSGMMSKRARPRGFRAALKYVVTGPWRRRNFTLSSRTKLLKYFDKDMLKGEILLDNIVVRTLAPLESDADGREFSFGLYNTSNQALIMALAADSEEERSTWVGAIQYTCHSRFNSDAMVLTVGDGLQGIRSKAFFSTIVEQDQLKDDPTATLRSVKRAVDIKFEGFCSVKRYGHPNIFMRIFRSRSWDRRKAVVSGQSKKLQFFSGTKLKDEVGLTNVLAQKLNSDDEASEGYQFAVGLFVKPELTLAFVIATDSEHERRQWIMNINKISHDLSKSRPEAHKNYNDEFLNYTEEDSHMKSDISDDNDRQSFEASDYSKPSTITGVTRMTEGYGRSTSTIEL